MDVQMQKAGTVVVVVCRESCHIRDPCHSSQRDSQMDRGGSQSRSTKVRHSKCSSASSVGDHAAGFGGVTHLSIDWVSPPGTPAGQLSPESGKTLHVRQVVGLGPETEPFSLRQAQRVGYQQGGPPFSETGGVAWRNDRQRADAASIEDCLDTSTSVEKRREWGLCDIRCGGVVVLAASAFQPIRNLVPKVRVWEMFSQRVVKIRF
ncbi:hypothetical protein CC78DRAFT_582978 [Lojkania enalia]|uniref:Uncharacterized protein n=1 Tax=Lojkania enalia TaxID=147567 RepID=A0A9P4K4P3_9PLEO|nr:hypothetical protein CC78DRAFT_582978 [Didymosphaeria enalia]